MKPTKIRSRKILKWTKSLLRILTLPWIICAQFVNDCQNLIDGINVRFFKKCTCRWKKWNNQNKQTITNHMTILFCITPVWNIGIDENQCQDSKSHRRCLPNSHHLRIWSREVSFYNQIFSSSFQSKCYGRRLNSRVSWVIQNNFNLMYSFSILYVKIRSPSEKKNE